jgi:hypothetical protein
MWYYFFIRPFVNRGLRKLWKNLSYIIKQKDYLPDIVILDINGRIVSTEFIVTREYLDRWEHDFRILVGTEVLASLSKGELSVIGPCPMDAEDTLILKERKKDGTIPTNT